MILCIILLILIILIVSLLLLFLFYRLFPSISKNQKDIKEDPVISNDEINYIEPVIEPFIPSDKKAVVLCSADKNLAFNNERFNPEHTCFMIASTHESGTDCKYACIGLGDCVKVCPQSAIIIKNHTALVTSLCIGCGKCIDVCPKHIIKLLPKDTGKISTCYNCITNGKNESGCSEKGEEKKLEWNNKKYFKIWAYCYKIFKHIIEYK